MKGSGIYEIHQQPAIVLSTGGVVGLLEVSNNMIAIYGNVVQWCKGILTVVTFSQLKRRLLARNIQQKGMFYIHNPNLKRASGFIAHETKGKNN